MRWTVLLPPPVTGTYGADDVSVVVDARYDARPLPGRIQKHVAAEWRRQIHRAEIAGKRPPVSLPKLRLACVRTTGSRIRLCIGITDYGSYLGLRSNWTALRLLRDHSQSRNLSVDDFLPHVLGNVALLVMGNGAVLGVLRSNAVSTYRGYVDLPGGHTEADEVFGKNPREAGQALFQSIQSEVVEEVGLLQSECSDPRLLAIVANRRDIMTPDMVFVMRARISPDEIIERARRTASTEIRHPLVLTKQRRPQRMTPICEAALEIGQRAGVLW